MRNDPFGQQQQGAPRRRGLFGNVRWWVLLAFAGYAAFSWISSKQTDPYTGEDAHYGATPQEESELGTQAYQQVLGEAQQQQALLPADHQTS
ncbi:MAG: M48 family peptidase, partial [Pseudoxanthomonas sp.]